MYFKDEHIEQFKTEFEAVNGKLDALMYRFISRAYREPRSKEFALQGFMRRISSMARCITNVFTLLPPESEDIPRREARRDAEISIKAFVFDAFAATDNLAWIWVNEKSICKPNGNELANVEVGLRKPHVRGAFSDDFRSYLDSLADWFAHQEDFRHALAHRIPLYIPPHMIKPEHEKPYRDFETAMNAASQKGDTAEYERLRAEQKKLIFFRPWMTHSFIENAKHVVFHAQLLADFNTIDELAHKFLGELDR